MTRLFQVGRRLLSVDSNKKGGTAEFRDLSQELVDLVGQLPDAALREPVLGCLQDMQKSFVGKTKAWSQNCDAIFRPPDGAKRLRHRGNRSFNRL
eukprot:g18002.t1